MINTTLCYIRRGEEYLMLHRIKKENDLNHDKWIGIGGKFEDKESPEDCLLREALEETGLTLTGYRCRGVVTFVSDEGVLEWIPKEQLLKIPHWEGDEIFLDLIWRDAPFFSLKVCYEGDRLARAVLNGTVIR